MNIIPITPNPDGSYRQIQSGWPAGTPVPSTHAVWPDTLDTTDFYACGGFGTLTVEGQTVTAFTPNAEAYEEWKTEHPETPVDPEPEPTLEDRVSTLETSKADQTSVDELNEALNMILTGVTE